jgi:hypothetical protein
MSVGRLMMLFGLTIVPAGLVFGMSTLNGGSARVAMYTELACLAFGGLIFLAGLSLEKKRQ